MRRISSLALGIVGLMLLLGGGPIWAQNTKDGAGALHSNTTGKFNSAFGEDVLYNNTTGSDNTASGMDALYGNTTGTNNTASGEGALQTNSTGGGNTAFGGAALYLNTTGNYNAADGTNALYSNTTGSANTADGAFALYANTTGGDNTASGSNALFDNTTGHDNTASGAYALESNTTGSNNTASGAAALSSNTTGTGNTAFGVEAGRANTSGAHNTFIGTSASSTAGNFSNGTALGYGATLRVSNSIVLGNSSISRIDAEVTSITAISDRRRKKDIAGLGSELGIGFIEKLKPVSYRLNNGDETQRYGFIAQDVEHALPESLSATVETSAPEHGLALIQRDNDRDRTYRMSYGELLAPLVKSVQEQQQEIAALRHALADQAAANDALRRSIETLREQVTAVKLTRN